MKIMIPTIATVFVKVPVFPNKAPRAAKANPIEVTNLYTVYSRYPDSKLVELRA